MPAHIFSDCLPEGEIGWELAHAFVKAGHQVTVVAVYADIKKATLEEIEKRGIRLRLLPFFSFRTVGWMPIHLFFVYVASWLLSWRSRFDLVFCVENCSQAFCFWKIAPVAVRALRSYEYENPKYKEALAKDRQNKRLEVGLPAKEPLFVRIIDFLAAKFFQNFAREYYPQSLDIIFCQTRDLIPAFQKTHASSRIAYLPNGVSLDIYSPKEGMNREQERPFIFLFAGRVARRKGIEYLAEGFRSLCRSTSKPVELWFVGGGEIGYRRQVQEQYFADLPVRFFPEVSFLDLPVFFHLSDVFVLPSLAESFSTSVLKSWACARPVIFSRGGGANDYFCHEAGILVEPASAVELEQAMKMVLSFTRAERERMGEEGRAHVERGFSWDQVVRIITGTAS